MKKIYIRPSVEQTQLIASAVILVGSLTPSNVNNEGGGGSGIEPD